MSFVGRLLESITGRAKRRIPRELEILGASADVVAQARIKSDVEQEEMLLRHVRGKHATVLDWRARRDAIYDALLPLLTEEERRLLPQKDDIPDSASLAVVRIRHALSASQRTLVRTESFGDFTILFLISRDRAEALEECAGPWLIQDDPKA